MFRLFCKKEEKKIVTEKKIGADTEIGPLFRFPIQKPGFRRTLPSRLHSDKINPKTKEVG